MQAKCDGFEETSCGVRRRRGVVQQPLEAEADWQSRRGNRTVILPLSCLHLRQNIYTTCHNAGAFFFFFSEKQQTRRNKAFQSWQGGKCKKVIIKSTEKYIFCLFTALSISFYSKNGEICAPFLLERTCSNLVLSPTSILYLEKKQKTLS